ncbi:solute carrier family 22 member 8-like [Ctenocephalides felis]|uniref:solute carrier family 22 member 8-like n=1 Tax=Ctenocephalides felis TaxID=7515 RepID=UPI000E6E3211|nr:solute carrier family 22 member 8-like [Ctenocephalides felis]
MTASLCLLSILAIPQESSIALMIVGLVGRLCISGVFSVVILHTSELFPTLNRNSAIGSSSTMAHVGSIAAPYIVDLLGALAWFIPTTICGAFALASGFLVLLLPETKGKALCDTLEEIDSPGQGKVSVKNLCHSS